MGLIIRIRNTTEFGPFSLTFFPKTFNSLFSQKSKKVLKELKPKKSLKRLIKFLPNKKSFFHPFSNIKTHHHLFLCFDDLRGKLAVFLHITLLVRHKIKSKRNKEVRTPKKKKRW